MLTHMSRPVATLGAAFVFARPRKGGGWDVGVPVSGPDGRLTLAEKIDGLSTVQAQQWLDARRVAAAGAR